MKKKRILIIKLGALGDAVMASTMLSAIKKTYPHSHITWLCGSEILSLVQNFPDIDSIIVVDNKKLAGNLFNKIVFIVSCWTKLFLRRYDICITAHSDYRYRLLSFFIFCGDRRQFKGRLGPIPGRFHGVDYARLVTLTDNVICEDFPITQVSMSPSVITKDMVLLLPGGAKNILSNDQLRRWPIDYYKKLAVKLLDNNISVGIIGGKGDLWTEEYFSDIDVTSFIGKTSITELLSLISGCKVLITHDSGPLHLAYLVEAKFIAIMGPVLGIERIPSKFLDNIVSCNMLCSPCYDGKYYAQCTNNLCLKNISVTLVMNKLRHLNLIE